VVTLDASYAASTHQDGTLAIWRLDGTRVAQFTGDYPLTICAAYGKRHVAAADGVGHLHLFALEAV